MLCYAMLATVWTDLKPWIWPLAEEGLEQGGGEA
jgi:hypothetical protein